MKKEHNFNFPTKRDKQAYEAICDLIKMPIAAQKMYHHSSAAVPSGFNSHNIYDNEDAIHMTRVHFGVYFGNSGYYFKNNKYSATGVTYSKTGPSTSRLKIWNGKNYRDVIEIIKELVSKLNPEALYLLNNDRRPIITRGILSNIIAGKFKNDIDIIEHHIKYSLRSGIKVSSAPGLLKMYQNFNYNSHTVKKILSITYDPNGFIEKFQTDVELKDMLNHLDDEIINLALQSNTKIDWTDPSLNLNKLHGELVRKTSVIKDILLLWEGGYTYMFDGVRGSSSVKNFNNHKDGTTDWRLRRRVPTLHGI